jgi:hypothetical protein
MACLSAYPILFRLPNKWQRLLRHRGSLAELTMGQSGELHRIAREIGLNANDFQVIACAHRGASETATRA